MKNRVARITLVCVGLMVIRLLFASQSDAKIDPKTIVGTWLFDEAKGDTAKDSSENGYNGKITGADWMKGKFGDALSFDKGDTVTAILGTGTVRNNITILMWINFLSLAGQQNYFSIWDSSNNRYVPYKPEGNIFRCWSNNWDIPTEVSVSAKTWYHVANAYRRLKSFYPC